jgi:hypothetical protein
MLLEVYIIASLVGPRFILHPSTEDEIGFAPQVLVPQKQQRPIGLDSVQNELRLAILGKPSHPQTVLEIPPSQSIETLDVEMNREKVQK